jgi:hypothetical protein
MTYGISKYFMKKKLSQFMSFGRLHCTCNSESFCVQIPLPAILKLEYGNSGIGVRLISELDEAVEHIKHVERALLAEDHPGTGLGHGKTMILTECLRGTEHTVDVVMFKGRLLAAFISDNGPACMPLLMEAASVMPSVMPAGKPTLSLFTDIFCDVHIFTFSNNLKQRSRQNLVI